MLAAAGTSHRKFDMVQTWAKLGLCLAPVAQRIEHLTTDQKVRGSNPCGRTH